MANDKIEIGQETLNDAVLKKIVDDYGYCYKTASEHVLTFLRECVDQFQIPESVKYNLIAKGIELFNETAIKLSASSVANKNNLLLKALESSGNTIGMLGQGGLTIEQQQFAIYYEALKKIMELAGVEIASFEPKPTPEEKYAGLSNDELQNMINTLTQANSTLPDGFKIDTQIKEIQDELNRRLNSGGASGDVDLSQYTDEELRDAISVFEDMLLDPIFSMFSSEIKELKKKYEEELARRG